MWELDSIHDEKIVKLINDHAAEKVNVEFTVKGLSDLMCVIAFVEGTQKTATQTQMMPGAPRLDGLIPSTGDARNQVARAFTALLYEKTQGVKAPVRATEMTNEELGKTSVYVITLIETDEAKHYVITQEDWDSLNDEDDLCEQIGSLKPLGKFFDVCELFIAVGDNNWAIMGSAEGVQY